VCRFLTAHQHIKGYLVPSLEYEQDRQTDRRDRTHYHAIFMVGNNINNT